MFLTFCFTACYLKKTQQKTAFQRILQLQYKFFYLICSFLRISVAVGCIFEAISALKLRCLWWTRTFLQKTSFLNVGCLCQYLSTICKHCFCQNAVRRFLAIIFATCFRRIENFCNAKENISGQFSFFLQKNKACVILNKVLVFRTEELFVWKKY